MNNDSIIYQHQHVAWQQRLNKELKNKKRYVEKSYKNGFSKNGPWLAVHDLEGHMMSSYPVPHHVTNQGRKIDKLTAGFINDGSGTNPCDPNSMQDLGRNGNTIYSYKVKTQPSGTRIVKSKVPEKSPPLNKCFYRFGSKSSIRKSLENPKSQQLNKMYAEMKSRIMNKDK